jgi:hypothetical protein
VAVEVVSKKHGAVLPNHRRIVGRNDRADEEQQENDRRKF